MHPGASLTPSFAPSVTPTVTPAPSTPVHETSLFPSRQPLTSAGGPYTAVLKLVCDELAKPASAALLAADDVPPSQWSIGLRAALADPALLDAPNATSLARGLRALLVAWPPTSGQKHFALLYMARLLVASSEVCADALLDAGVPAVLLRGDAGVLGGVLDAAEAPKKEARGARLMALALLANITARPAAAARLLADADSAAAVVGAAFRALGASDDAPVGQMGGALGHNLAIGLTPETNASEHAPPLLAAAVGAIRALAEAPAADAEYLGRALSVAGHLLAPSAAAGEGGGVDMDALAVALSLDAHDTLERVKPKAASLGHAALVDKVAALLQLEVM